MLSCKFLVGSLWRNAELVKKMEKEPETAPFEKPNAKGCATQFKSLPLHSARRLRGAGVHVLASDQGPHAVSAGPHSLIPLVAQAFRPEESLFAGAPSNSKACPTHKAKNCLPFACPPVKGAPPARLWMTRPFAFQTSRSLIARLVAS